MGTKKLLYIMPILLFYTLSMAKWGEKPINWGDFQMGLVNNGRPHWDEPMRDAHQIVENGKQPYKLDRRYIYIDDTTNMKAYWGVDGVAHSNWSKEPYYKDVGVNPAIVIYMVQRGGDAWPTAEAGMADREFMKEYFRYITVIADSSKGTKPIYVLEPDVWTYMLQNAREHDPLNQNPDTKHDDWSKIEDNNFNSPCHINDLGYEWLEEFENKASNLPGAIIKTIKMRDPEAHVGILVGFWGFKPNSATETGLFLDKSEVIAVAARETGKFADSLLSSTPYRGDFTGIEKNGTDQGYWTSMGNAYGNYLNWDDRSNGDWVKFAQTVGQATDLPLVGWQIAIGHENLPNTLNAYTDTFFPYFFRNTQDYIDAGFIGMLAGAANQDRGTIAVPPGGKSYVNGSFNESTKGDEGWFYSQYKEFNRARPWLSARDTFFTVIAEVIPDSIFTPGECSAPEWNPTITYKEYGGVVTYEGHTYEQLNHWSSMGIKPSDAPGEWLDLGPCGSLEIVAGGTVSNENIFYREGDNVSHSFKPESLEGYGVGSITVNGEEVEPSSQIDIANIDRDYRIRVKFVKGGKPLSTKSIPVQATEVLRVTKSDIMIYKRAEVTLFNLRGQQLISEQVNSGGRVRLSSLPMGVYVARIKGVNWVREMKISIR